MSCIFCNYDLSVVLFSGKTVVCLSLPQNVLIGSCIIIPKQHRETVFDLTSDEWNETWEMLNRVKNFLDEKYKPDGYNVGWNVGETGGQEIFHVHLHVIPRYKDEPFAGKGIRHWLKKTDNIRLSNKGRKLNNPIIVAVSAISGGGKTTIVQYLNKILPNSKAVYFDDYDYKKQPDDIAKWIDNGSKFDEWDLKEFINDIDKILNNDKNVEYIFLDYPFAYQHIQVKDYIDLAVFIDTPKDISLARRLIRDFNNEPDGKILEALKFYLDISRKYFLILDDTLNMKTNSDTIIDGSLSLETIAERIMAEIENRHQI